MSQLCLGREDSALSYPILGEPANRARFLGILTNFTNIEISFPRCDLKYSRKEQMTENVFTGLHGVGGLVDQEPRRAEQQCMTVHKGQRHRSAEW